MNTKENSINVHEYPENATPLELARYQVAVMEAAERGEPVEFMHSALEGHEWEAISYCAWEWSHGVRYRIARPKIAEGHNPDKLTEATVGVQDGWRLLSAEELPAELEECDRSDAVQQRGPGGTSWTEITPTCAWQNSWSYRTKNPPGHYLPKPEPVKKEEETDLAKAFGAWWSSRKGCYRGEEHRAVAELAWYEATNQMKNHIAKWN